MEVTESVNKMFMLTDNYLIHMIKKTYIFRYI